MTDNKIDRRWNTVLCWERCVSQLCFFFFDSSDSFIVVRTRSIKIVCIFSVFFEVKCVNQLRGSVLYSPKMSILLMEVTVYRVMDKQGPSVCWKLQHPAVGSSIVCIFVYVHQNSGKTRWNSGCTYTWYCLVSCRSVVSKLSSAFIKYSCMIIHMVKWYFG